MGAGQRARDIIEKVMIGGGSMTAMRALAAVDPLMLVLSMHHRFLLIGRCEVPCSCFLVINPNNRMVV
jgi:hypothetical protein